MVRNWATSKGMTVPSGKESGLPDPSRAAWNVSARVVNSAPPARTACKSARRAFSTCSVSEYSVSSPM
eukprot:6191895-Alexandrium_andersonii.AAC.1